MQCQSMPTMKQNVCCHGYSNTKQLKASAKCITETPMFRDNCLNRNVLETSRHEYIEWNGPFGDAEKLNELVFTNKYDVHRFCEEK